MTGDNMAKLVKVAVRVPELVPAGSPVEVVYPTPYVAAAHAAGGMFQGVVSSDIVDGWRAIKNLYGNPLFVYGGESGDPLPPLLQIRVKPRATGIKGMDWHIEGHPRDTGGGEWDGSAYGSNKGEVMATEQQRAGLDAATALALAAAEDARLRAANLGGIRQIEVTSLYVALFDTTGTRLTPSTHVTPNGYTLETITIEGI